MVGLTAAGIDQATAFAAAICYRLCTYYLPPVWGWSLSTPWSALAYLKSCEPWFGPLTAAAPAGIP